MTYDNVMVLLDYNYWARDRLVEALALLTDDQFTCELRSSFGSIRNTVAHMCEAELIWLKRLRGEQPEGFRPADRTVTLPDIYDEWSAIERGMRQLIATLNTEGVERAVEYIDFRGERHSSAYWEIVRHVVNRGSYHRGQVTTMLRELGGSTPRHMHLIVYCRERAKGNRENLRTIQRNEL